MSGSRYPDWHRDVYLTCQAPSVRQRTTLRDTLRTVATAVRHTRAATAHTNPRGRALRALLRTLLVVVLVAIGAAFVVGPASTSVPVAHVRAAR
ncbi:MAG TPA: hypothetical protein VGC57_16065 [Cellulomonas sp.]